MGLHKKGFALNDSRFLLGTKRFFNRRETEDAEEKRSIFTKITTLN